MVSRRYGGVMTGNADTTQLGTTAHTAGSAAEAARGVSPAEPGPAISPAFDVLMHGPTFVDLVFTGLTALPELGTEIHSDGLTVMPGGAATWAVATARLGLRPALTTTLGEDTYGQWCHKVLVGKGVDLSHTRTVPQPTNLTVAMPVDGDRALLTYAPDSPLGADDLLAPPPHARAVIMDLKPERLHERWWRDAAANGALLFADVGWDETGAWDPALLEPLEHCHAFTPNEQEAMAFTRTSTVEDALAALADRTPITVVTRGAKGVIAVERESGEQVRADAVEVPLVDPTGAGDVFLAGLTYARLAGWGLRETVDFAVLVSALSVTEPGVSLSAPGWDQIAAWRAGVTGRRIPSHGTDAPSSGGMHAVSSDAAHVPSSGGTHLHMPPDWVTPDAGLAARFEFLDDVVN